MSDVSGVMEQGDDHAQHGAARAQLALLADAAVVAVQQARHGQRAVQAVLGVVIPGVAAVVARQPAGVKLAEGGEGVIQRLRIDAGIARLEHRFHCGAHLGRV
jgi:hypothetical protein